MESTALFEPDLIRLALLAGMILSVFLYEKSHLTTGSIVVPGFLGIHVFQPAEILACLVNSLACFWIVHRLAPRLCLMTNKTKFHALIAISVLLHFSWHLLARVHDPIAIPGSSLAGLGFVFPALIAHDMYRNGPLKTLVNSLLISSMIAALVFALICWQPDLASGPFRFALPIHYERVFLMAISILGSLVIKIRTGLRCGYVTGAYVVLFGYAPNLLILISLVAISTCWINRLLMKSMIVFGRRKFALMLIVGAILMWSGLIVCRNLGIGDAVSDHPAYAGILTLLPGLVANEIQRTGHLKFSLGLGLVAFWTYSTCHLFYEFGSCLRPHFVIPLMAGASAILCWVSFSRYLVELWSQVVPVFTFSKQEHS